jgi:outer membrane protein TolC
MRKQQANGYASGMDVATQQTLLLQLQQQLPPLQKSLEQTRNLVATLMARTPDQAPICPVKLPAAAAASGRAITAGRAAPRYPRSRNSGAAGQRGRAPPPPRLPQLSISAAYGGATRVLRACSRQANVLVTGRQPACADLQWRHAAGAPGRQAELEASAASYKGTVLSHFRMWPMRCMPWIRTPRLCR